MADNDPTYPYLDKDDPGVDGLPDIFSNWLSKLLVAAETEKGNPLDPAWENEIEKGRAAQKQAVAIQFDFDEIDAELKELDATGGGPSINSDPGKVRDEAIARLRARQDVLVTAAETLIRTIPDANAITALGKAEDANPYSLSAGVSALSSIALDEIEKAASEAREKFVTWRNQPDSPQANIREAATRAVTREGTEGYGELVAEGVSTPFGGSQTLRRTQTPTTDDERIGGILDDLGEQLSVAREEAVTRLVELAPNGANFGDDGVALYGALGYLGHTLGYTVDELLTSDVITAPALELGASEGEIRSYAGIKDYLAVAFVEDFNHYQTVTGNLPFREDMEAILDEFIATGVGSDPKQGSIRDHDGGSGQEVALERIKNQDIIDAIDLSISEIDTANKSWHQLLQSNDRSAFTYTEKVLLAEGINGRFSSDSAYQGIISDRTSEKIVDVRERVEPELKRIGIESPEAMLLATRNKITTVAPNWKGAGHPTARAATRSAAATGNVSDPGQRDADQVGSPVSGVGPAIPDGTTAEKPSVWNYDPDGVAASIGDVPGPVSASAASAQLDKDLGATTATSAVGTSRGLGSASAADYWANKYEPADTGGQDPLALMTALMDAGLDHATAYQQAYGPTTTTPTGPTKPPRRSAAEIQAANKDAVYDLLAEEFGGFSFFLKRNDSSLMVGLSADGSILAADDPNAATVKNVLDVIVDKGLTDFSRIQGVLKNTQWWQDTDAQARDFDIRYGDMSDPEQLEYLEPIMDVLYDQADYLGFELTAERARENAVLLARAGDGADEDAIREMMGGEQAFSAMGSEVSEFSARRKEIQSLSAQYYVPISDEDAAKYAEQEYIGELSAVEIQNMFKQSAIGSFGPAIESAINAGFTTEQYFAPYKYEIEKMLDRPNINLYEEFGDVIEYMPDTGGDVSRPMTLGETRKYVRGLDEWQTSTSGQDSARSLAFAIGKTFGEVA